MGLPGRGLAGVCLLRRQGAGFSRDLQGLRECLDEDCASLIACDTYKERINSKDSCSFVT